jgi:hypothetical protein
MESCRRKQQDGPLELRRDFAQHKDAFAFQLFKVSQFHTPEHGRSIQNGR